MELFCSSFGRRLDYKGYWKDDKTNGKGILIHADGNVSEGDSLMIKPNHTINEHFKIELLILILFYKFFFFLS